MSQSETECGMCDVSIVPHAGGAALMLHHSTQGAWRIELTRDEARALMDDLEAIVGSAFARPQERMALAAKAQAPAAL